MRGTLYVLGDGYKTKKCMNSWRGLLEMRRRVLRGLSSFLHRSVRKAWNRWYDRGVKAEAVRRKMRGALSTALRKGFNTFREHHELTTLVGHSLASTGAEKDCRSRRGAPGRR